MTSYLNSGHFRMCSWPSRNHSSDVRRNAIQDMEGWLRPRPWIHGYLLPKYHDHTTQQGWHYKQKVIEIINYVQTSWENWKVWKTEKQWSSEFHRSLKTIIPRPLLTCARFMARIQLRQKEIGHSIPEKAWSNKQEPEVREKMFASCWETPCYPSFAGSDYKMSYQNDISYSTSGEYGNHIVLLYYIIHTEISYIYTHI